MGARAVTAPMRRFDIPRSFVGHVRWPSAWTVSCDWACACDSEIFMGSCTAGLECTEKSLVWQSLATCMACSCASVDIVSTVAFPVRLHRAVHVWICVPRTGRQMCVPVCVCVCVRVCVCVCRNCHRSLQAASPCSRIMCFG